MRSKIMLLVFAALTTVYACTKKSSNPKTNVTPSESTGKVDYSKYALMGLDSPFLKPDTANIMIESYLQARTNTEDLKALIVDAEALRYYLSNPAIKHVKLMFAHKMSYVRDGGQGVYGGLNSNALTIVIAGFDAANNYIYSDQGAVMDFCLPCPVQCPENGTAGYDVFPE